MQIGPVFKFNAAKCILIINGQGVLWAKLLFSIFIPFATKSSKYFITFIMEIISFFPFLIQSYSHRRYQLFCGYSSKLVSRFISH